MNFAMEVIQKLAIMGWTSGLVGTPGKSGAKGKNTFNRRRGQASANIWYPIFAMFSATHSSLQRPQSISGS
jgi:hypothetical protein